MFNNIGKKIKQIARWSFVLEAIGSIITGLVIMIEDDFDEETVLVGLCIAVGGFFVAWLIAMFIYAFGELVDKTCEIAKNTYDLNESVAKKKQVTPEEKKKPQNKEQEKPTHKASAMKDDDFVDVFCPNCGKKLAYSKDIKSATCPWCDHTFDI